jgi:O-antigen ligase
LACHRFYSSALRSYLGADGGDQVKRLGHSAMKKHNKQSIPLPVEGQSTPSVPIKWLLWAVLGVNSVFFIWQCLDRYLSPRFLFLSMALLLGLWFLRKPLLALKSWELHGFDLLMIGWYLFNGASVFWAFNWSEAVFTAQKSLLLLTCYGLFRYFFTLNNTKTRGVILDIVHTLTAVSCLILIGQLGYAALKMGLSNNALYDYASGLSGNKSLAADFLFLLLGLQVLFRREQSRPWVAPLAVILLCALILVLQVRTVYGAVFMAALLYFSLSLRQVLGQRNLLLKKILPLFMLFALGLATLVFGTKGSLAERLNPMNYLDSTSLNERRFVWYKTDLLNADHYWLGVGAGSWKLWFPSKNIQGAYRLQEENIVFTRVHNDYLEVRAEMGILGAIYYLLLFLLAFATATWALWRGKGGEELKALTATLVGYCIIQYFDFPRERIEMQVFLALLLAWMAQSSRDFWEKGPVLGISRAKGVLLWVLGGLLAFNVCIGWYRVKGEIGIVKMFMAIQQSKAQQVFELAEESCNPFLEYSDVALPLCWYQGLSKLQTNQAKEAIPYLARAYQLNPWSFQVLNNYATALAMSGNNRDAIPLMEKVLEINPAYDDGKMNLAITYKEIGENDKAANMLARVDTIPNPSTEGARLKNREINARKAQILESWKKDLKR